MNSAAFFMSGLFSLTIPLFPQFEFQPYTITNNTLGPQSVFAVDLDQDGNMVLLQVDHRTA